MKDESQNTGRIKLIATAFPLKLRTNLKQFSYNVACKYAHMDSCRELDVLPSKGASAVV